MIEELKFWGKFTHKYFLGGRAGLDRGGGVVGLVGGQGGCERRIEVFAKIQKKKIFFFWGGVGWVGGMGVGLGGVNLVGGQGGCERRIKVFVKIQKKKNFFFLGGGGSGGGSGGGRVGGVGGLGWM